VTRTRLGLVGTGLIGGSIGLGLATSPDFEIVAGYDRDPANLSAAAAAGAVGKQAGDLTEVGSTADLVVVAVPVSSIARVVLDVAASCRPGTIITDVGSVKAPVVTEVEAGLPDSIHFVGGHPMAGSEQEGFAAASPDLFRNACWALTPTARSAPEAVAVVHRLVAALGAAPLTLEPASHDHIVAVVSHLPQVVASSLMNVAARKAHDAPPVLRMAAGGFRDVTRIAAGSPAVWEDILSENADAVGDVLDAYIDTLVAVRADLANRNAVRAFLEDAQRARRGLPTHVIPDEVANVVVAVSDHPGEAASVLTAVGEAGINVADFELRHSPEGGSGLLTLAVAAGAAAERAVRVLRGAGYAVHVERGVS
jgi:prephenate dehydrogenase